ncbi:methylamine utilization protein [Undibacterium sp. Dicai25W]|uniref:methylamine utilization protein n=1 Tax=Undibacterium sp. Dicai25W TaxID=3413034 RepID=UPI003BF0FC3A
MTVVQTGTLISFPNNDTVKHQAYSFSPAKTFELKLYSGKPSEPLLFDKAGTVTVGCNIHDQMLAYIHVVNTPFFAKTDAHGNATLSGLPQGKYILKVWHYQQATGSEPQAEEMKIGTESTPIAVHLKFKLR